jgi:hypothetical protein
LFGLCAFFHHNQPPAFNPDPAVYDRYLEAYIGQTGSQTELSEAEMDDALNKPFTIQVDMLFLKCTGFHVAYRMKNRLYWS